MAKVIEINRAPVLALWAAVVAKPLGNDEDAALTPENAATQPEISAPPISARRG